MENLIFCTVFTFEVMVLSSSSFFTKKQTNPSSKFVIYMYKAYGNLDLIIRELRKILKASFQALLQSFLQS